MFRIFGPPGTGKTTALINMVDKALDSGIPSTQIAFLAFTKKAANEAKQRASERFDLDPREDLPYFRTLHSLALSMSDIKSSQVMQKEHYDEFSKLIGISFKGKSIDMDPENISECNSTDHPIFGLINLARLRKVSLRDQYNISSVEFPWNTINYVDNCFTQYRQQYNLYDFTDMLEEFIKNSKKYCPSFKITFLDEAQDLSPLQWDIAHILDEKSEKMYAAGDDDQAIYRWAGADVDHFIGLEGSSETLSQSYRVPSAIHNVAESIVGRIRNRYPKKYNPRDVKGNVQHITDISDIPMDEGSWLILSQAAYNLNPVASGLKTSGYLFNNKGHRSISERTSSAVNGWERLRKGRKIPLEDVKNIYSYMSSGARIKRGFKRLTGANADDVFSMPDLQKYHGLLVGDELIWHEAMDKLPDEDRAYITKMLKRGEKFNGIPRITISTIHGAKGGEADNVVLFTDLSPAADDSMSLNGDDMHRVFYVGVTRAKQNLFILEADDLSLSYDL